MSTAFDRHHLLQDTITYISGSDSKCDGDLALRPPLGQAELLLAGMVLDEALEAACLEKSDVTERLCFSKIEP